MNRRAKYAIGLVIVVLAFLSPNLQAQGRLTLEGLSERIDTLFQFHHGNRNRIAALETRVAALPTPTPTRTPRPTPTRRPTPKPTATTDPAVQAALDESAANDWASRALQEAKNQKGIDWRKGGWMEWYNRPNVVKVFLATMDECGFTADSLVKLIARYARDKDVKAMYREYEPKLTIQMAIFRDLARAGSSCERAMEVYKSQYLKSKG